MHLSQRKALIEVGPAKAQDLAAAHAGRDRDRDRALKARSRHLLKDPLGQPGVDLGGLGPPRPGRLCTRGRVGAEVPPAHRLGERLGKHQVQVQHRPARERAAGPAKQRRVQPLQVQRRELRQGKLAEVGPPVQADQALVALPGLGPHPARCVLQPGIQVLTDALALHHLGKLHGSAMLAPAPGKAKRPLGP